MRNKDAILHFAINKKLKEKLTKIAKEHDVSVSSLVRVAVGQWILRFRKEK